MQGIAATTTHDTILIVNDTPDQLALAAAVLRQAGYGVLEAADGREALAVARREHPALIISDVVMPYGDGIELCRAVRADERLGRTPILLVSGHRKDAESVVEALDAGCDEYLEAPYEPMRLVAQVARLLERARLEGHYRDLVEQTSDIIYTFDLAGRLTSINAAGCRFAGRPRAELLQQHVGEVLGLADPHGRIAAAVERLRAEGARSEQAKGTDSTGRVRWLEFNQSLICDRAGVPLGVRGSARDITAHREMVAALRRSEERYRTLIESANDAIYTLDLAGRYTSLNRAGERLTGYTRAELCRLTWRELVAPGYVELTETMIARKLAGEEEITFYELEIIAKDGRQVPLEVSTQLVREGDRAVGILGIARDITERRRAETERRAMLEQQAELEKMRSLGQLSAGVAHNFNNALAAVLGRTQLLLRVVTDEKQRRSLQVIETAALDAAEIVRRIQTFARSTPPARFQPVSLAQLIADAIQLTRTRWEDDARAQGVRYEVRLVADGAGADLVAASASELREVFVNLILNALEAMPRGGAVECRARAEGDWLVAEIADTGPGIPVELRGRIFEPFFTTKGPQGSGLGLAVSYGIIKRHGGLIEVASGPGAGTTFTLRFPARRPEDDATAAAARRALPQARVLVVDDEAHVREVLLDMLETLGQRVTAVSSVAEARAALAAGDFDLIITDYAMPDTDGLTLAAEARAADPRRPVALTTGYGAAGAAEPLRTGLVQAVLGKPFQLAEVEAALRQLLNADALNAER
ncbi:MAG TPA: PAS domain S-box protein [Pyrinomonadaceae bacterium]|jgi:PAS domain S-box-containing protein